MLSSHTFFRMITLFGLIFGFFSQTATAAIYSVTQPWQSITPGAGGWYNAVGIGPSGLIVVASDLSGAYISATGSTWTPVGATQGLLSTHVSAVGFHKTDAGIVLLGTESGIYRSANQGKSFIQVQANGYITSIKFAPSAPATMYAVGHTEYNSTTPIIYQSTNSGTVWVKKASIGLSNARIQKLVVHPTKSTEIYAVSAPDRFANIALRMIYRSTDSGQNWSQFATTAGDAFDFAIATAFPYDMYLSSAKGVFYSANSGADWINTGKSLEYDYLNNNIGFSLWLDPVNPSKIRLVSNALSVWDNTRWGVWQGTKISSSKFSWAFQNNGINANFTKTGWEMPDYWHYNVLKINDLWSHFYYTGESLRTMAIDPRNASRMVFVNAQWVFNTSNGGIKFNQYFTNASGTGWRSRGIENVNVLDVAASRWATGNVIFGGYADLGCWRSLNDGLSWESCNPMQYAPSNVLAAATPSLRTFRQNLPNSAPSDLPTQARFGIPQLNLTPSRIQLAADMAATGGWNGTGGNATTFAIDPTRTGMVWTAIGDNISQQMTLMRSSNSGSFDSWQKADTGIAPADLKNIYGLSIDPNSPVTQRTLFVTANGEVYRSVDDGRNWVKVLSCKEQTNNLNYCVTTAVDFFNSKLVYAAGSAGLFVSTDGGDTWAWADTTQMTVTKSLPDIFEAYLDRYLISRVATDPFTPNKVYLAVLDTRNPGGRGGIWSSDSGNNWQRLYTNPYMRSVAASPFLKDELVATSSVAFTSGGYNTQSLGVLRLNNGIWQSLNQGLSYNNVATIAYGTASGRMVLGSMGQGVMRNWR
jgi:photosystem II stability/assembly factor-like uncharacterized protein